MREFISWLKEEESGQGMVEYGVIVALVVVIAIAVFSDKGGLKTAIEGLFEKVGKDITKITTPTTIPTE